MCAEVNAAVHSEISAAPAERLVIEREPQDQYRYWYRGSIWWWACRPVPLSHLGAWELHEMWDRQAGRGSLPPCASRNGPLVAQRAL